MKPRQLLRLIGSLLFLLLSAHPLAALSGWESPPVLDGALTISAEELLDFKAEFHNLVIIDARPADVANGLSIEGAIPLPGHALSPSDLATLAGDKFTPLVFFGADKSSGHSYRAAKTAVTLGYTNVFWFRGGLKEWLDKGMPVVKAQK